MISHFEYYNLKSKNTFGKPFRILNVKIGYWEKECVLFFLGGMGQLLLMHSCHISIAAYNFFLNN